MNYIPLTFTFIGAVGAYSYFANKTFIAEDIPKVSKKKKKTFCQVTYKYCSFNNISFNPFRKQLKL